MATSSFCLETSTSSCRARVSCSLASTTFLKQEECGTAYTGSLTPLLNSDWGVNISRHRSEAPTAPDFLDLLLLGPDLLLLTDPLLVLQVLGLLQLQGRKGDQCTAASWIPGSSAT